jgi:hypothetical protein
MMYTSSQGKKFVLDDLMTPGEGLKVGNGLPDDEKRLFVYGMYLHFV